MKKASFLFSVIAVVVGQFSAHAATVKIPEGVEVRVSADQTVSSATAQVGDRFSIRVLDPVTVDGVVVIPVGALGAAEVTAAEKRGRIGKAGQLSVRALYVIVGDKRVPLRGSKGQEGQGKVGTTVALTVLFGPLGLLKKGKDVQLQPGQAINGYVEQSVEVEVATPQQAAPTKTAEQKDVIPAAAPGSIGAASVAPGAENTTPATTSGADTATNATDGSTENKASVEGADVKKEPGGETPKTY